MGKTIKEDEQTLTDLYSAPSPFASKMSPSTIQLH